MESARRNILDETDFTRLVNLYLESEISPQEMSELNATLRSSEAHQQAFILLCMTHAAVVQEIHENAAVGLQQITGESEDPVDLNDVTIQPAITSDDTTGSTDDLVERFVITPDPPPVKKTGLTPIKRFGIAAGILLPLMTAGSIWWWPRQTTNCRLLASVDARWVGDSDGRLAAGSQLPSGVHTLTDGMVQLSFPNRFVAVVQAPAEFKILSDSKVQLLNGRICARGDRGATGMAVLTSDVTATDLGTEFAVNVIKGQSTHLEVFTGRVEVDLNSTSGTQVSKTLGVDEAIRVLANSGRLDPDVPNPSQFVRPAQMDAILAGQPRSHDEAVTPAVPAKPELTLIDVGSPKLPGTSSFDGKDWRIASDGQDTWNEADECTFVSRPIKGDFSIVTHVVQAAELVDGIQRHCGKAGVMVRDSNDPKSMFVNVVITTQRGLQLLCRSNLSPIAQDVKTVADLKEPLWIKLTRSGNSFTGYSSSDGTSWTKLGECSVPLQHEANAGLVVTSANPGILAKALFSGTTISDESTSTPPAAKDR